MPEIEFVHRTTCVNGGPADNCTSHWKVRLRAPDQETQLGEFDIVYCDKCRVGFTEPYPSEASCGLLYAQKSSSDFDRIQGSWIDRIKDRLARRLSRRLLADRDPASVRRVLDFSCGNARYAAAARDVFPNAEVDAVDVQTEPPPLLRGAPADRIVYKTAQQFDKSTDLFDLIFLRHVLEHTHPPVSVLRMLGARLAVGGVLYIEVPNLDSGCGRVFGRYWTGWYMPRHIFHFTPAALTNMVAEAGLVGTSYGSEMPLMGNQLAVLTGARKSNLLVQSLGVLLHPLQLVIETLYRSSTCISLRAVRR